MFTHVQPCHQGQKGEPGDLLPAKHHIFNTRLQATSRQTHLCQQQLLIHNCKSNDLTIKVNIILIFDINGIYDALVDIVSFA